MTSVVNVEGLCKSYILAHKQNTHDTLRDSLASAIRSLAGRVENPFGGVRTAAGTDRSLEEFWALKDVSFDIQQGARVGIVGRNGAGKSTLLKILSRITEPTRGRVTIRGRVASLLEVGTGFHPELTGRENVYLNGAVLGMSKADIRSKFDEIVAFAEVEQFLDTPVKRYSSGMYVRLAFAVAAHLEPEILIVDEVLAVGDIQFQKKCLGKMEEVGRGGRTVLFVSHNLTALRNLCTVGLLLEQGKAATIEDIGTVLSRYTYGAAPSNQAIELPDLAHDGSVARIRRVAVEINRGRLDDRISVDTPFGIRISVAVHRPNEDVGAFLHCYNDEGTLVFSSGSLFEKSLNGMRLDLGMHEFTCRIPEHLLNDGEYTLDAFLIGDRSQTIAKEASILRFRVHDRPTEIEGWHWRPAGVVRPQLSWVHQVL